MYFKRQCVNVISACKKERGVLGFLSNLMSFKLALKKNINKREHVFLPLSCDSRTWNSDSHLVAVLSWIMDSPPISPEIDLGSQLFPPHISVWFGLGRCDLRQEGIRKYISCGQHTKYVGFTGISLLSLSHCCYTSPGNHHLLPTPAPH